MHPYEEVFTCPKPSPPPYATPLRALLGSNQGVGGFFISNRFGVEAVGKGGGRSYGLLAKSSDGDVNRGVYSIADGPSGSEVIAVYGRIGGDNESDDALAGKFAGDVHITGDLSGASDRKLKEGIQDLGPAGASTAGASGSTSAASGRSEARSGLLQLQPKRFQYRRSDYEAMGLPEGEHYGLIAQQVQEHFPALVEEVTRPEEVTRDDEGRVTARTEAMSYLSVSYQELIPLLIQTAREQQAELDAARAKNDAMREELDSLRQRVEALER